MNKKKQHYDNFLAEIYEYSPYFGKERREKDYATQYYIDNLPDKKDGRILELVTCTGLLTIPIAKAGYKIDSVDASPAVHEIVKRKLEFESKIVTDNISLKCSDVFEYCTENRYSAIVMPDSFLLAIADKQSQEDLIRKCYGLLKENGILIADIFTPWKDIIEKKEVNQCSRFRTKEDELFIVYTHHQVDAQKQMHKFDFIHESYKNKNRYHHTVIYRYMYLDNLIDLFQKNGFEIIDISEKMNFGRNISIVVRK